MSQDYTSDDIEYRKNKKSEPKVKEDDDYYGYTDNNAGRGLDNNFSVRPMGAMDEIGTFRKHKSNKAKLVRKRVIKKKCKCK
jgi:hypothetical protein